MCRSARSINVCERTDGLWGLPPEVMCRVQRGKTWSSGQRGCILSPCQGQNGNPGYLIAFEPKKKGSLLNEEKGTWKGEVLVDQEQFEPVLIVTELAKGVPLWIRTVFGFNVKQVGFKMAYEEFDDGVWFPVTYGGEFKIKALFFYKRTIAVSMLNTGFQRAEVTSSVEFAGEVTSQP